MLRARNKHANAPRDARDSLLRVDMLLSLACRLRSTRSSPSTVLLVRCGGCPLGLSSYSGMLVDFAALSHRLVVEVDGGVHRESEARSRSSQRRCAEVR
jgi:Protein of unknown function (DUF559)